MQLRPVGYHLTLQLAQAPELAQALRTALAGWPLAPVVDDVETRPMLTVARDGVGYRQGTAEAAPPRRLPSVTTAVCSLIADLIPAALAERPEQIGLHCAAVEVAQRLVLFPAAHRAGKSLLSAAFAAAGRRVYGDDVLALTPSGAGMALGIAPRLRWPLPEGLSPALARYIAAHTTLSDARYGYLGLGAHLAAHGDTCPLGAIVLLQREPGRVVPQLTRLSPGDGLLQLLCQSFAAAPQQAALLERLYPRLPTLPCLLLRYADPQAAVARVVATLEEGAALDAPGTVMPAPHAAVAPPVARLGGGSVRWQRCGGVIERPLGETLFLIDAAGGVHRLNAVAAAVWRLLGVEPLMRDEMVDVLTAHFVDVAPGQLAADLVRLLDALAAAGLIVATATAGVPADPAWPRR